MLPASHSPKAKSRTPRAGVLARKKAATTGTPRRLPLTWDEVIALTLGELKRLGLAATHRVAALHSAPDVTAEGAPFAAIILPRRGKAASPAASGKGWKLLIGPEGQISRHAWEGKGPRARLAQG